MAEYSRLAHGKFTSTGSTKVINLPFQPDYVELINYTSASNQTQHGVPFAWWDSNMGAGFAVEEVFTASALTGDVVVANGITPFAAGLMLQFGAAQQVVSATAANPAVFTVTGHGYSVGDTVVFQGLYQSSTTGMAQMDGIPFTISAVTTNTFTVKWNASGSNYTALSGSPTGAFVKKVLYPFLYCPGVGFISALTLSSTTTVVTTNYHNMVVGQEVAFRMPTTPTWGATQLNSLPNVTIPGSPIYGYVTSITDNWTFVVNINSTGYTAFNPNQTIASVPGLSFPTVIPVGDINTGGPVITSTSPLYPSPSFPTSSSGVMTINGPAISGAFVNNTSQGFIIGTGAGSTDTSSKLVGANADVIYWRALLHDYNNPSS